MGSAIPVLVAKARAAVVEAHVTLTRLARAQRALLTQAQTSLTHRAALRDGSSGVSHAWRLREEVFLSLSRRLGLSTETALALEALWDTASARPPDNEPGYADPLFYAARDWSGRPEAEGEVATVVGRLESFVAAHASDRSTAVVLGAAGGRYASELLGLFDQVNAVERAIPMGVVFDQLRAGDLACALVDQNNSQTVSDQAQALTLSLTRVQRRPRVPGASVAYAIADARRLPLPEASQSAVVSVLFTDVTPLPTLLRECRRVLKPGGLFMHFGPLDHHSTDVGQQFSVEEVRAAFSNAGFALLEESWHPGFHRERAGALAQRWFNSWAFVARLERASVRVAQAGDRPLAIASAFRLTSSTTFSPPGVSNEATALSVTLDDGTQLQLGLEARVLLSLVNGRSSFPHLLEQLEAEYELSPGTRDGLASLVDLLVEQRLLEFLPALRD